MSTCLMFNRHTDRELYIRIMRYYTSRYLHSFRKSQTRKTWDGFVVCKKDWEPRHPQDIGQTPREDKQFVKDARPEPDEVFLDSPSTGEDL